MTNVNAAIGVAQMEYIDKILENKRETALLYKEFCENNGYRFFNEPKNCKSNFWLNAILLKDREKRNSFLDFSYNNGVMCRPIWRLMNKLESFKKCYCFNLNSPSLKRI